MPTTDPAITPALFERLVMVRTARAGLGTCEVDEARRTSVGGITGGRRAVISYRERDGVGLYPHSRYNGIWEQKSAWGFEFREFRDTQAVVERWRHEYRRDSDNKRAQQKQALLT